MGRARPLRHWRATGEQPSRDGPCPLGWRRPTTRQAPTTDKLSVLPICRQLDSFAASPEGVLCHEPMQRADGGPLPIVWQRLVGATACSTEVRTTICFRTARLCASRTRRAFRCTRPLWRRSGERAGHTVGRGRRRYRRRGALLRRHCRLARPSRAAVGPQRQGGREDPHVGDRASFSNRELDPQAPRPHLIRSNPHYCRSALSRYTPTDFIGLVGRHGIALHEKRKGQLFCDRYAKHLIQMLGRKAEARGAQRWQPCKVRATRLRADALDSMDTDRGSVRSRPLETATGRSPILIMQRPRSKASMRRAASWSAAAARGSATKQGDGRSRRCLDALRPKGIDRHSADDGTPTLHRGTAGAPPRSGANRRAR